VQPTAFITSGFNTPNAFQPQEAIISGNKLGSIHINMLHTLSQNTVKPLLTDLYGGNHGSDKPIIRMSEGKGDVVIDVNKYVEDKDIISKVETKTCKLLL
jgi:hypothetical protein